MSKPGVDPPSGISSVDVLIPTERHPACRQREARPGSCMERENLAGDGKGKGASTFGLAVGAAWLLRACGERQCRGSTKQGYEIASSYELPSNEAHNLAHHWTMRAPVHRSEIFMLLSVQGHFRRIDAPDDFAACPLCLR